MTQEIDLIISGGGVKFYYLTGIKKAFESYGNKLKIKRYAGTSSGSLFVTLMACQVKNSEIIKTCQFIFQKELDKMKSIKVALEMLLPTNAHIICSNKVFISVTKLQLPLKNKIISKFKSRNELINTILASCSFPLFVNKRIYLENKKEKYIDGFFTNNTPYFKDNIRKQIIIKPFLIEYENLKIFDYEPNSYIKYVSIGYQQFKLFINGNKLLPIEWYQKGKKSYFSIRQYYIFLSNFINFRKIILLILLIIIIKNIAKK